ncbi:MAG: hypothetical protein NUW00_03755 [Candidatus Kaiserbacteria bacterium]|nr:hypothetical protein [Candidatus Kaiserbacteria bacterium]
MKTIIWSTHPKYAVSNKKLWQQFFETASAEEQEYLLLLILENAEDNDERWDVFSYSDTSSTKEEALFAMLPYASTFNELRRVMIHTTDDMWEVRERLIAKALTTYRTQLSLARNNRQRWRLCNDMTIETLRNDALSEILTHSTSNGERWWVFFNTKSPNLKARALKEILTIRKTKRT